MIIFRGSPVQCDADDCEAAATRLFTPKPDDTVQVGDCLDVLARCDDHAAEVADNERYAEWQPGRGQVR